MGNIKINHVKRIETVLDNGRPAIPEQGINHVDDANLWGNDMLYVGELGLDITNGKLYTQDGTQPVEFGGDDYIVEGLEIRTSGSSLREINVSSGKVRIKGRLYGYDSLVDVDDSIITIDTNIYTYPRIDSIYVTGDILNYNEDTELYGVNFTVVKGDLTSQVLPYFDVPENSIFLGFVAVYPNQTPQDILRPLSIYDFYDSPKNIKPAQFLKDIKSRVPRWKVNTLYFEGQKVEWDNNLYLVAVTHISTDVEQDFSDDKLVSLGAVTNSNVSRFSHVGSVPTLGNWIDFYFENWTANTRILDAFKDISEFIKSFAPTKPLNIDEVTLQFLNDPANNVGIATLPFSSNVVSNVYGYLDTIEAVTSSNFTPYDWGILKSYLFTPSTSYSTSNFDLSDVPETLPDITTLTDISSKYNFTIKRDDHYGDLQGFKGFYKSVFANLKVIDYLTPSEDPYEFIVSHLTSSSNINGTFYVESDRDVTVSNVGNIFATVLTDAVKYESGIPVLTENDTISISYDIDDAVRYFYNHDKVSVIRTNFASNVIVDLDNDYITPKPPYTLLSSNIADGETLYVQDIPISVKSNVSEGTINFVIEGYNSLDEYTSSYVPFANILIDDVYSETGNRLYSNSGDFPENYGIDWGWVYDEEQSMANIITNDELQYFSNKYFYPKIDYTETYKPIYFEGNVIPYPNYDTANSNVYRWATFDTGYIENEQFVTLKITGSTGLTYDLEDGELVTNNVKMYAKVVSDGIEITGWLDINKALDSLNPNPQDDGDTALDLSWMVNNPIYRRLSFGTVNRTGNVFVRLGTNSRDITFSDVVQINYNPEENDGLWDVFTLGDIIAESYVVFGIVGHNGTILADFLNGTTMTSNFDIQLRVWNEDNPSLGTDWIDCNESYPANNFIPYEYDDPALDLSYYEYGIPNPTTRKITFGPTTRTGEVQVRIRITGCQQYTDIDMLYPTC